MKNLTISGRILVLGGSLLSVILIVGFSGITQNGYLSKQIGRLVSEEVPKIRNLVLIDMVHDGARGVALSAYLGAVTNDKERLEEASKDIEEHAKNVSGSYEIIEKLELSDNFREEVVGTRELMNQYLAATRELIKAAKLGDLEASKGRMIDVQERFESLEKRLSKQADDAQLEDELYFSEVIAGAKTASRFGVALTAVGFLIALFLSLWITRNSKKTMVAIGEALSRGMSGVSRAVSQLTGASQELATSSMQQASALQKTATSIDEIAAMARKSADMASESETVSARSRERAEIGERVVNELLDSMKAITASNAVVTSEVETSNQKISEIISVIHEISAKTRVIHDIVFQTKLLSFNASVEAARAGEHGKGFAVVAEEVGGLASMSGDAAKEISDLLEGSVKKVEEIVSQTNERVSKLMGESQATVNKGARIAEKFGDIFKGIVIGSGEVSELITSISVANREQALGVTEISSAVQQLDQATQVNSHAARRCATTAESLTELVSSLKVASEEMQKLTLGRTKIELFEWREEYAIGVDAMDSEHQLLIERINSFAVAMEGGKLKAMIDAFDALADYTREHFMHEEEFQDLIGYPDLIAHKAIHAELLSKLDQVGADVRAQNVNPAQVMNFISEWLLKHIMGTDMKYANHSRKSK